MKLRFLTLKFEVLVMNITLIIHVFTCVAYVLRFVFLSFFFNWNPRVSLPWVKPCTILTVHFHLTKANRSERFIPIRIRRMSPVVIVNDISPVVRTGDVDRIRYRGVGVVGVLKTQHSVLFVCCVGDVHRKSQEQPRYQIFI